VNKVYKERRINCVIKLTST